MVPCRTLDLNPVPEILNPLLDYAIGHVRSAFAEVSIGLFALGTLLLLLGIAVMAITVYTRVVGYRTSGTVAGAIGEVTIKEKIRNGKPIQETRETFHAVFQYRRPDGSLHQEKASEGGTHVLRYRTGQTVKLLVVPGIDFDDVYDADQTSGHVLGGVMFVLGALLIWQAATLYAALGISMTALLVILMGLILKARRSEKITVRPAARHYKIIEPGTIRPVEEFAARKADA